MEVSLKEFEQLRERVFNFDITALYPFLLYYASGIFYTQADGFSDKDREEDFEQLLNVCEELIEQGNQTGIPQYILYLGADVQGAEAVRRGEENLVQEYCDRACNYLDEAMELGFSLAYRDFGRALFFGDYIFEKDEEKGLAFLKKATEIPLISEIGLDIEATTQEIIDLYETCLEEYNSNKQEKVASNGESNPVAATESAKRGFDEEKPFTKGYFISAILAFFGYTLFSAFIRIYFNLPSAYEVSVSYHWALGILVTLLLNYAIIPLLMMAYFYKQNNEKHNKFLVALYVTYLLWCFIESFLPHIINGQALSEIDLKSVLIYPTVFLVVHRLLSLLIYAIIRGKEGESDYRIYYGIALFAPFMAVIFAIALPVLVIIFIISCCGSDNTGSSNAGSSNGNDFQTSEPKKSWELKEEVRKQLVERGGYNYAVYYDNTPTYEEGWKVVDYWNQGYSLKKVEGDQWGYTYFKDPNGKLYILPTNTPDKEKIYYFD